MKIKGISIFPIFLLSGCLYSSLPSNNLNKEEALYHYNLGVTYLREGNSVLALKELLDADSLYPDSPQTLHALGLVYFSKNELDKASEYFKGAIHLDPNFSEAHNNLGSLFLEKGLWNDAIIELEQALNNSLYQTPEIVYNNLGYAYYRKEDLETSLRYLKKALEIDPTFDRAHYNLGLVYLAQEKKEDAVREFKETFRLSPLTIWGQLAKQHLEGLK